MSSTIDFLVRPPLETSGRKVLSALDRSSEALFLPLPRSFDELVVELILGLGYEEFKEEVRRRKLLPEPVESWLRDNRPILERLRELGRRMVTYCYRDDEAFNEGCRTSIRIAMLVLRDSLRERPDVDEWLRELDRERRVREDALEKEANLLREEAVSYKKSTCVAGFEACRLRRILGEEFITRIHYLETPYHFTPLEVLRRMISIKKVSRDMAERLIREHLRFVREYVIPYGVDKSRRVWTVENLSWHPQCSRGWEKTLEDKAGED